MCRHGYNLSAILCNHKLSTSAVKVKYTPEGDSVMKISEGAVDRLRHIFGKEHEFMPLIYTTKTAVPSKIPNSSICFNREGLSEYTQGFGYLKLVSDGKLF